MMMSQRRLTLLTILTGFLIGTVVFITNDQVGTFLHGSGRVQTGQQGTIAIIFSSVRSGSSFVGNFFLSNKDICYIYEPLHIGSQTGALPDIRELMVGPGNAALVAQLLERFLSCNTSSLSSKVKRDMIISKSSARDEFHACMKRKKSDCFKMWDRICTSRKYKATKLVRATMEDMKQLLSRNTNNNIKYKIIHLLRDPRGKINSYLKYIPVSKFEKSISEICARQLKDITIRHELEKQYPDVFLEIHYEDVAMHPMEMAKRIYNFAFVSDVPKSVKKWIQLNTNSHNNKLKEKAFGTERKNSTATAFAWKSKLSAKNIKIIQSHCKELLNYLGLTIL